jgi:hypothetical protein
MRYDLKITGRGRVAAGVPAGAARRQGVRNGRAAV